MLQKPVGTNTYCKEECQFNGSFMHVIHQFYFAIQKRLEHALLTEGPVTFSQFLILVGCSCSPTKTLTQAKLAENLMLTEATVSRHVKTLVEKGLVSKEKDVHNKKIYTLTLTKSGVHACDKAFAAVNKELEASFVKIPQKDKHHIITLFSQTLSFLHTKE